MGGRGARHGTHRHTDLVTCPDGHRDANPDLLGAGTAAVLVAWLGAGVMVWNPDAARLRAASLSEFERQLAAMREPLGIPGLSGGHAVFELGGK
jgi:hypothetical protein